LATTEINKIPATILSRCQRHDFRRLTPEIIAERLRVVCAGENIEIEARAVNLIARLANGAMRDALNILEAVQGSAGDGVLGVPQEKISVDYVLKTAGHFDSAKIIEICECVKNKDAEAALVIFWEMYDASLDCANFCGALLETFRNIQVAKIMREPDNYINEDAREIAQIIEIARDFDNAELMRCYELVSEVFAGLNRYTANKRVAVEMLLCEMCMTVGVAAINTAAETTGRASAFPVKNQPQSSGEKKIFAAFADMIEEIAKENRQVSQFLKGAVCEADGSNMFIKVENELAENVLRNNIPIIKKYAAQYTGGNCDVAVEMAKKADEGGNRNSIDDIEV
jgi:DNA polymerase III gamma/tau subunit